MHYIQIWRDAADINHDYDQRRLLSALVFASLVNPEDRHLWFK